MAASVSNRRGGESVKFKLAADEIALSTLSERIVARARMARYGTWYDNGWWEPPSQQSCDDAMKRIEREGFVIEEQI